MSIAPHTLTSAFQLGQLLKAWPGRCGGPPGAGGVEEGQPPVGRRVLGTERAEAAAPQDTGAGGQPVAPH